MRKSHLIIPAFAVVLFLGIAAPAQAAALTESQIQAIIGLLNSFGADQTVVANVNASLRGVPTTAAPQSSACLSLNNNLSLNASDATTGGEVSKLQGFLGGKVTGYFGPATLQLVQKWQASHGVVSSGSPDTSGYGSVGLKTRTAMMRLCGSSSDAAQELLAAKRQQVRQGLAEQSESLFSDLVSFVQKIRASSRGDIPNARAFAAQWGDRTVTIYAAVQARQQQNVDSMTLAELEALLTEIQKIRTDRDAMLAAYNVISYSELEKVNGQ